MFFGTNTFHAMTDNGGRGVRNTGGNKYEMTAREIQNYQIGAFFGIWQITFRKVTPTALKVNVKKF